MFRKRASIALLVFAIGMFFGASVGEAARPSDLYFIDAHSQISEDVVLQTVIRRMDDHGVHRTILSANAKRGTDDIAAFAAAHPGRIIAAVRTKGGRYRDGDPEYFQQLEEQAGSKFYGAMAEVMIWHAPKHDKKGKITVQSGSYYNVLPSDSRVREAVKAAVSRGWPFVMHIEFAGLLRQEGRGRRDLFMKGLKRFLNEYPRHPFVLNKMGQLSAAGVGRLIRAHPNIHFLTDHSTNPRQRRPPEDRWAEPWVNIFQSGKEFAPEWAALFVQHPERFIFALDMVRDRHWRKKKYRRAVRFFRRALSRLPAPVARAIAHGNAERLWRLPPKAP